MEDKPFDLQDEEVVAELVLQVRRSGAMSVAGCIHDPFALNMLDAARDVVTSHIARKKINEGSSLILPPENAFIRG